jgi:hypothetical protein
MRLKLLAATLLVACPTIASGQQDEVVRTLADIRASTGERVLVESVKTGIIMPRITVSRGSTDAEMTFLGPELESWTAESEEMLTKKIAVGRDETAKSYGPRLGMEGHTTIQFARETDSKTVTNLFMISDADNKIVLVAGLTSAQARALIRALRRASLLAQGRPVEDSPIERASSLPAPSARGESTVMGRCLLAARLQIEASDERTGRPSQLQYDAREANVRSICKTMPAAYLPELR